MTPRMPMPIIGSQYGYGLEVDVFRGHRRVGHGGAMTGYGAAMAVLPDRHVGVAVLANGDGAVLSTVVDRVLELLAGDDSSRPLELTLQRAAFALPSAQLDAYLGVFANPRRFTVQIVRQGDQLILRRFGRDFPMRPLAADRFRVDRPSGGDEIIIVGLDEAGRAAYLQMNVWALARMPR